MNAGAAPPLPVWSGNTRGRVRMSRTGNRQLNAALHRIAVTQIRLDGLGRTYYRKRLDQGDSKVEALRCLKRRLCRVVFNALHTDQQPTHTPREPPPRGLRLDIGETHDRSCAPTSPTRTISSGCAAPARTTSKASTSTCRSVGSRCSRACRGSGKSSLVFATIAAESQRMINETYSSFVQGFMPSLARPEVDVLEGLTTAIIVDQERLGANPRSTVGTVTDTNALLRILFSRLGDPHIGSPNAYSFNVPSVSAQGAITVQKGNKTIERASFTQLGGMCPRCEGMGGRVNDIDLTQLFDDSKSLAEGAITIPGYTADGWYVKIFSESGFLKADKPIRDYTKRELHDFLYKEPVKVPVSGGQYDL